METETKKYPHHLQFKGYFEMYGKITRQSEKAVYFEFSLPSLYDSRWIPKKAIKLVNPRGEAGLIALAISKPDQYRYFIAEWFYDTMVNPPKPKRMTKQELCEKFKRELRRVHVDDSYTTDFALNQIQKRSDKEFLDNCVEKAKEEQKFYGNVDAVLKKVLDGAK